MSCCFTEVFRTFKKMKLALLLLFLVLCGPTLFGKQTRHVGKHTHHVGKHTRHSRKQVRHVLRHSHRKPTVSMQTMAPAFSDTRRLALLQYFQACACPAAHWVHTFVQEADRQGIDWRLVASISMIESTGGKHYRNRNILGWKSARARFRSEQVGIQYVSARLGHSPLYHGKSLIQILRTYNSERRNYAGLVTGVMQQLAAIENRFKTQQASLTAHAFPSFQREWRRVAGEPVFLN